MDSREMERPVVSTSWVWETRAACAAAETLQAKATLAMFLLSPTAWPSERASKVPGAGSTQTNRGENWGRGDAIAMSEKERPPTTRNWRPRPTTAAWWPYSFYSFQDCRRPHPARAAWWLKFIGPCEHSVQSRHCQTNVFKRTIR